MLKKIKAKVDKFDKKIKNSIDEYMYIYITQIGILELRKCI